MSEAQTGPSIEGGSSSVVALEASCFGGHTVSKQSMRVQRSPETQVLPFIGPGCPGQWWSPHPWRGSKTV